MARIFLSYAHEDRAAAKRIVEALAREGLQAWWDHEIPPGRSWDEMIGARLDAADIVIVLWSKRSTASNFVKEEAQLALDAGKLMPLTIEAVDPPIGFRRVHAADLSDWRGEPSHGQWRVVLGEIQSRLGDAPSAAAPARSAPIRARIVIAGIGALILAAGGVAAWSVSKRPPSPPPMRAHTSATVKPQAPPQQATEVPPQQNIAASQPQRIARVAAPEAASVAQTVWEGPLRRDSGRSSRWAVRFNADGTAAMDFMDGRGFIDTGDWTWTQSGRNVRLQHVSGNYAEATVHGGEMSGTLMTPASPRDSGAFRFEKK